MDPAIHLRKHFSSFGRFDNFPDLIHGRLKIGHRTTLLKMYQIIVQTLKKLNNFTVRRKLSDATHSIRHEGSMIFEIGIADGSYFHFLDHETMTQLTDYQQLITNQQASVFLDVLVVVSYHYHKQNKKISLNSDHNILRFVITSMELYIYLHNAKGIRRLPLDQFLQRILEQTHDQMKKNHLKTFNVIEFNTI